MTPTVADTFTAFIEACQADWLSEESVKYYRYALKWLVASHGAAAIDQVDVRHIRQYLVDLRSANVRYVAARQRRATPGGLSVETIRSRVRALKRFFAWAYAEYGLDPAQNPMNRIRMPHAPKAQPKAIALEDLRKLLLACPDNRSGKRDKALIAFLADTGCRAGGALSLVPADLFCDQGRAYLREKGDRTRVVPFTQYTAELLREWLAVRPEQAVTVFCALGTDAARYGSILTVSGLDQMLIRLKRKAGVSGRCNPHSFRHGFARMYLEHGGDLATLAQLMGHSTVNVTTQYYARFTDQELARRHEQFSPLRDL
jgi:integrase/recombinase XerD